MKKRDCSFRQFGFAVFAFIPLLLTAQGIEVKTGGTISFTGAATIQIDNGDLINNGTISTTGTEKVSLSGNTAKTISGTGSTSMYDLYISNTGGITNKHSQVNIHNLTVYSGSKLTIDTTSAIVVSNVFRNKATVNDLIIKSNPNAPNGSLVFHNLQDSALSATIEMYSKASKVNGTSKWQFFGIPLRSMPASPNFDGSYVRKFNEAGTGSGTTADKHWIQLSSSNTLTPFTGYEITQTSGKTFTFKGELVNSDYTSGKLPITIGAQYPGQHLIGNPYAAAIDITKIQFGSPRAGVIENTIYLYNSGSYNDWLTGGSGNTSGESVGQYVGIPQHLAGQNGIPGQIPSMQAFLIAAVSNNDSAKITIPYSSVGTAVKNTSKQRTKAESVTSTRIDVAGTRFSDKMWLFSNENCSNTFDNGWDCYKMFGSTICPQIFTLEEDGAYQINAVNDINNTTIGFVPGEDSQYTLTFTHENIENKYACLYLQDLVNNKVIDISQNKSQYSFSTIGYETVTNRFKILTSAGTTTSNNANLSTQRMVLFSAGANVFVDNNSNENGTLTIYNALGKIVYKSKFGSNEIYKSPTNLTSGCYMATANTNTHKISTKLIIN